MSVEYSDSDLRKNKNLTNIPVVAMRDTVVFPNTMYPILAGRPRSIKALNKAYNSDGYLLLCAQRQMNTEEPEWEEYELALPDPFHLFLFSDGLLEVLGAASLDQMRNLLN